MPPGDNSMFAGISESSQYNKLQSPTRLGKIPQRAHPAIFQQKVPTAYPLGKHGIVKFLAHHNSSTNSVIISPDASTDSPPLLPWLRVPIRIFKGGVLYQFPSPASFVWKCKRAPLWPYIPNRRTTSFPGIAHRKNTPRNGSGRDGFGDVRE